MAKPGKKQKPLEAIAIKKNPRDIQDSIDYSMAGSPQSLSFFRQQNNEAVSTFASNKTLQYQQTISSNATPIIAGNVEQEVAGSNIVSQQAAGQVNDNMRNVFGTILERSKIEAMELIKIIVLKYFQQFGAERCLQTLNENSEDLINYAKQLKQDENFSRIKFFEEDIINFISQNKHFHFVHKIVGQNALAFLKASKVEDSSLQVIKQNSSRIIIAETSIKQDKSFKVVEDSDKFDAATITSSTLSENLNDEDRFKLKVLRLRDNMLNFKRIMSKTVTPDYIPLQNLLDRFDLIMLPLLDGLNEIIKTSSHKTWLRRAISLKNDARLNAFIEGALHFYKEIQKWEAQYKFNSFTNFIAKFGAYSDKKQLLKNLDIMKEYFKDVPEIHGSFQKIRSSKFIIKAEALPCPFTKYIKIFDPSFIESKKIFPVEKSEVKAASKTNVYKAQYIAELLKVEKFIGNFRKELIGKENSFVLDGYKETVSIKIPENYKAVNDVFAIFLEATKNIRTAFLLVYVDKIEANERHLVIRQRNKTLLTALRKAYNELNDYYDNHSFGFGVANMLALFGRYPNKNQFQANLYKIKVILADHIDALEKAWDKFDKQKQLEQKVNVRLTL